MSFKILSGTGNGKEARVTSKNRLDVDTTSLSEQARISREDKQTYQVSGEIAIAAADSPVLFLRNDSSNKIVVVTCIRVSTIGAAASNAAAYWTLLLGGTFTSGGVTATPTNLNVSSSNAADVTALDGSSSLVIAGGIQIDKDFTANDTLSFSTDGSIILGKSDGLALNFLGSTAAGTAFANVTFYLSDPESI